jgi:hypothetical protein
MCKVCRSVIMPDCENKSVLSAFFSGLLISFVRVYQYIISPLLPPTCRYIPTCSQYAIEALGRHGVCRGSFMAVLRILRCHPFAKGGYDPVTQRKGMPHR